MTGNKSELRAEAKARRQGRACTEPTSLLQDFLQQSFMPQAKIGVFYNKVGELATTKIISELGKHFQLFAPAVTANDLVWRRVDGNITIGKFNIAEPASGEIISVNELDCVLVPALAVDHAGNRLGFGAGYFDRSLQNSPAMKIALVFDQDIVKDINSEDHDIKVDYISTESRLIKVEN